MDDDRAWRLEESLWLEGAGRYRATVDPACLMILPASPFVFDRDRAIAALDQTERWAEVRVKNKHLARPQDGVVVLAYACEARRAGEDAYRAHCSSVYRRVGPGDWRLIQHQQTPD